MKTEIAHFLPGGNSSRKRFRKPFPLGAPEPLVAPLEGLLETARVLSGAARTMVFAMEGREVTLVATRGDGAATPSRLAARALAEGVVLTEPGEGGGYIRAIPMADSPHPGNERRRFRPRSSLTSACLVLEGMGSGPAPAFDENAGAALGRALLAAIEARAFADAVATDRSTGALTRAALERAAGNEFARAGDAEHPAALVLIEVVPRQSGLEVEVAEEAMAAAAVALRQALRTSDLVGRRGPDELAALLVDADPTSLSATVERVLAQVALALEPLGVDRPILGAASFPAHGASLAEIDAAALDALESARATGAGTAKVFDPALGRSPTACRKSFFTGDPGLDARKAAMLFEGILAANAARELREALDAVLSALLAATGAQRAAVLSGDGGKLELAASRDHDGHPIDPPLRFSRSACLRALALGRAVAIADPQGAGDGSGHGSHEGDPNTVLAVPLLGRSGPVGVLYADSHRPASKSHGPEDLAYLEALASQAAIAIENAGQREQLEEENAALKRAARRGSDATMLLGTSPSFRDALRCLPEIVEGVAPLLLLGEPGTGKELLARKIHELGPRGKGHFVSQNCAAMPAELLDSELFGHAAGAFPGAARAKRGLIELASGGTLLLDEVGDLPLLLQAKLLRVLEDGEARRLGETRGQKIDFRLICSTHKDLLQEVDEGRFRRDLFHRINVFTLTLPPLRERKEDIPELARHFAARAAQRLGRPQPAISAAAMAILDASPWPGNVRELANVLEKAVSLVREGSVEPVHLGLDAGDAPAAAGGQLRVVLAQVEKDLVADALRSHDGNVSAAARTLGIARQQVQRLMKKYQLKG